MSTILVSTPQGSGRSTPSAHLKGHSHRLTSGAAFSASALRREEHRPGHCVVGNAMPHVVIY